MNFDSLILYSLAKLWSRTKYKKCNKLEGLKKVIYLERG